MSGIGHQAYFLLLKGHFVQKISAVGAVVRILNRHLRSNGDFVRILSGAGGWRPNHPTMVMLLPTYLPTYPPIYLPIYRPSRPPVSRHQVSEANKRRVKANVRVGRVLACRGLRRRQRRRRRLDFATQGEEAALAQPANFQELSRALSSVKLDWRFIPFRLHLPHLPMRPTHRPGHPSQVSRQLQRVTRAVPCKANKCKEPFTLRGWVRVKRLEHEHDNRLAVDGRRVRAGSGPSPSPSPTPRARAPEATSVGLREEVALPEEFSRCKFYPVRGLLWPKAKSSRGAPHVKVKDGSASACASSSSSTSARVFDSSPATDDRVYPNAADGGGVQARCGVGKGADARDLHLHLRAKLKATPGGGEASAGGYARSAVSMPVWMGPQRAEGRGKVGVGADLEGVHVARSRTRKGSRDPGRCVCMYVRWTKHPEWDAVKGARDGSAGERDWVLEPERKRQLESRGKRVLWENHHESPPPGVRAPHVGSVPKDRGLSILIFIRGLDTSAEGR
ncbi:hypothetical protein DFH09DRAFT_1407112 [Mycena vulgaris]|nr:hypothetical protein DFH09DRAFT_1407112 [Mycena vulgaris]